MESAPPLTAHTPPSHPSHNLETLTPEMLTQLQSQQISVPQFSLLLINVVSTLVPCLLTRDSSHLGGGEGGRSSSLSVDSCHSLSLCVEALSTVVCLCEGMGEAQCGRQEVSTHSLFMDGCVCTALMVLN